MRTSYKLLIGCMALLMTSGLAAATAVNDLTCTTYDHHTIDVSDITYSDNTANNGPSGERMMSPGEQVTLNFEYNLPACDNAVDHSRHVINFYNADGELLGTKTDLQMKQGNWDSYTVYSIPVKIPEFNTSSVSVELNVYASSVHGSDVWHEVNAEDTYDKVIKDTVENAYNELNLKQLPISDDNINMLQNTYTSSDPMDSSGMWGDCANIDHTINNNSYVDTDNPGLRIARDDWNMDSGGGHPCYIFTAYDQAVSLYNFYKVIDHNGQGDNQIHQASTCGPNPNNQHNGGGESLGHSRTFERGCPDLDGDGWAGQDVACDDGTRKQASNNDNELIDVTIDGETRYFASDGNRWWSVRQADTTQDACQAFLDAGQSGDWASGDIVAEASGNSSARCNLGLTNDKFIVDDTLYNDGSSTTCSDNLDTGASVTIDGTTYYCKGIVE